MSTRYTKDHEWIRLDGDVATVGITEHAQEQLGDIVYVELPEIGRKVTKGGDAAVVESVKAASDVYSPASGEVVAINDALGATPGANRQNAFRCDTLLSRQVSRRHPGRSDHGRYPLQQGS